MLNCLYNGKRINALSIENEDYEYRKEIKLAGTNKQLICEDCNTPMVFKICTQRISHFAHWKNMSIDCTYNDYSTSETEEHRQCKMILYKYFKRLYPDALVETEYKVLPNRRSDIFVMFNDKSKLVLDIQRRDLSVSKWENKHKDYKNAGITDIWLIAGIPFGEKEKNMPFFQQVAINESIDRIALFLDNSTEKITLMKKMIFVNSKTGKEYSDLYTNKYHLKDVKILPDGKIEGDFHFCFESAENLFCSRWIGKIEEEERQRQIDINPSINKRSVLESVFPENIEWDDLDESNSDLYKNYRNISNERYEKGYTRANYKQNTSKINGNYYTNNYHIKRKIKAFINKAVNGNREFIDYLVNLLHSRMENYQAFEEVYKDISNQGNLIEKEICEEVFRKSGFWQE